MEVTFTARHTEIPEAVRKHSAERLDRLVRIEKRPTHAEILFDTERGQKKVEIRLVVAGGGTFIAEGAGANQRAAVDAAVERLKRQLKREHERETDHQAPKISP